jgi:beta-N-acetylhexosaminidase
MNLKEKIGQLLIVGFEGASVNHNSPVIRDIKNANLGGVILFDRFLAKKLPMNNILSASQTLELIDDLQDCAHGTLLVAVDQEGGRVSRFKEDRGFPQTLPAAELGSAPDTTATTTAADSTARLLSELGFNLNLAPVVDLNSFANNPIIGKYQRSFSNDSQTVIEHAAAWVNAHRKHGILTCLKHFPGHGSAREDSHLGFVDISLTWQKEELIPYRQLMDRGMVDTVMTGHLFNSVLDSQYPATLSAKTLTGLLRNELGYTGPVISDDMQMRAITSRYGLEEAVCMAINAGVDLLVFGNNLDYDPQIVTKVINTLTLAVQRGTVAEEQIEAAWQRVQLLKQPLRTHTT